MCAKFRCEQLSTYYTRALRILIEFRIRSKYNKWDGHQDNNIDSTSSPAPESFKGKSWHQIMHHLRNSKCRIDKVLLLAMPCRMPLSNQIKVLSSCPAYLACSFGICIISTVAHAFTLVSSTLISVLSTDLFLSNICEDFLHCFGPFSTVPGMFRVLSIWSITVRHFWWALSWFLWISHSVSYPSLGLFWHILGFFTTFFLCKCTL